MRRWRPHTSNGAERLEYCIQCSPVLYDFQRSKQGQKFASFISEMVLLCHSLMTAWKSSFADHYHHVKVASFLQLLIINQALPGSQHVAQSHLGHQLRWNALQVMTSNPKGDKSEIHVSKEKKNMRRLFNTTL